MMMLRLAAPEVLVPLRGPETCMTSLAPRDCPAGVKNAINFDGIKNFTGAFAPPWAVVNNFDLLD